MRLAYTDEGPGPAVVLLHGFPLGRAMWKEQVAAIGSMYRVIAPDLRGHGESPAPDGDYTIDEMADDVIELLDTLGLDVPVVAGGLSMGGYVALSLAERYPDRLRALLLMDTRAAADSPEALANREELAQAVLKAGNPSPAIEAMIPRLFSPWFVENRPELVAPLRRVMERNSARGVVGALRAMAARPDRTHVLAGIRVPTLVLVGEEDAITPPVELQAMADAIPGARLEVVPRAGHLAPYENPPVANGVILRFLDEHTEPLAHPPS
jgi:pimeloyl-ACP methyl ester carboxylesterase